MRERIESKHVTKEIKSQMPVISPEIIKERGCTFCPYYLGSYEKQPRCMMKNCAWNYWNAVRFMRRCGKHISGQRTGL